MQLQEIHFLYRNILRVHSKRGIYLWVKNKRGDIFMNIEGMSIKFPPSKEYVALVAHCANGQEIVLEAFKTVEEAVKEMREFERFVSESEIIHELGFTGESARLKKLLLVLSGESRF